MPDVNTPLRRDDLDEREQKAIEARMRLALEQMGSEARLRQDVPGLGPVALQVAPARRGAVALAPSSTGSVRTGLLTLPTSPTRQPSAVERDLAEERAARQRADQALLEAQATIGQLQAALAQCEQARDAALASANDKEAKITALRADLQQQAARTKAAASATAEQGTRNEASATVPGVEQTGSVGVPAGAAKPKRPRAATRNKGPQPVKWWLKA